MKIKGSKVAGGSWTTLGLPSIFLLCLFFFLAGFFGASLFSQQESPTSNLRPRTRELVEEVMDLKGIPHAHRDSGEDSVEIPARTLHLNSISVMD